MSQHPARNTPASSIDEPLYSGCGFLHSRTPNIRPLEALYGHTSCVILTWEILNAKTLAIRLRKAGSPRSVSPQTLCMPVWLPSLKAEAESAEGWVRGI